LFSFFFFFHKAREAAKSGLVLFHEAMERFNDRDLQGSFGRFERAAAKGHEESIWIVSVVDDLKMTLLETFATWVVSVFKDVEMGKSVLKEAFVKTEKPRGWCCAGRRSDRRERFDFYKNSAEAGCSWGQVEYGWYFEAGQIVEKDEKVYVEWLEKAAKRNNPGAIHRLGAWFRRKGGNEKAKELSHYRAAAALGWSLSMGWLARILKEGDGCERDFREAALWSVKGQYTDSFWRVLEEAQAAWEQDTLEEYLECDFHQLCYSLGWGVFWRMLGEDWERISFESEAFFAERCLDYYCSCVELQQKSIFTFLLCWNQTVGIKGPGQMIGKMVWEEREDNMVKLFE
jgi:hypothetical protein